MPPKILIQNIVFTFFNIYCTLWNNNCSFDLMRDTYGKRQYLCKCGKVTEDYIWKSKLAKHKVDCIQCGKPLGFVQLITSKTGQLTSIRTPTKNR